jgi:RNA polymerase sigma factor (sigma-70 family)
MAEPRNPHLITRADHEHMAAIAAGSHSSWGRLYERHLTSLVRFCGNFTADPQLAEDWAQEAFVLLRDSARTFQSGAELKPWLYKIARNVCLKHIRRQREVHWSDSVFATQAKWLIDSGPHSAKKADIADLTQQARELLQCLTEEQRTMFILRYVEGLSRKDIAETMDIPEAVVKSRLGHTMNAIRKKIIRKDSA